MDIRRQLSIKNQTCWMDQDHVCHYQKAPSTGVRFWMLSMLSHLFFAFLVIQLVNFLPGFQSRPALTRSSYTDLLYSPASGALQYEIIVPEANSWERSEFFQTPSHKLDARWAEFFQIRGISFSEIEAAQLNMSSLPLNEGRQAVVTGIYHNLHCLRTLFQTIHNDYYYPEESAVKRQENVHHAHHCLEAIRHSVTCNPDLSAYEIFWEDVETLEVAARTDLPQVCANQKYFWDWMRARIFTHEEMVAASGLA